MPRFDYDRFYGINHHKAALEAFKAVCNFKGQPEHMVAGLAFLFIECCSEFAVEPRAALTAASRMIAQCDHHGNTLDRGHRDAIRNYLRNEILEKDSAA